MNRTSHPNKPRRTLLLAAALALASPLAPAQSNWPSKPVTRRARPATRSRNGTTVSRVVNVPSKSNAATTSMSRMW